MVGPLWLWSGIGGKARERAQVIKIKWQNGKFHSKSMWTFQGGYIPISTILNLVFRGGVDNVHLNIFGWGQSKLAYIVSVNFAFAS